MKILSIDIYSDVMCPWCIIGYRKLLKALDELEGEISVETRWRPFELNPDMPPEGEERTAHIARKYGRSMEQAREGAAQMQSIAERVDYSFEWEGEGEAPTALMRNTFLAHKLLAHALDAAGGEVQTDLKLVLFDAHFRERRDVADREVLLELAEKVGLEREPAAAALDDEALGQRIRAEERAAFDANITGVPAMVVAGKFLIPGAQEPETYATALRRVAERT